MSRLPPRFRKGDAVSTTRTITAKKAADVLYRYMRARQFDEIYIEPESRPPIVLDG